MENQTENVEQTNEQLIPYPEMLKTHFLLAMEKLVIIEAAEIPVEWLAYAEALTLEGLTDKEKSETMFQCIVAIANAAFNSLTDLGEVPAQEQEQADE